MPQTVYLDLSPEMQRQMPGSLRALLEGQGVAIPPGIVLGEGPMPAAEAGVRDKDWGIVIQISLDPVPLAAAVALIVLAVSQFLRDRAHEPKVILVDEVEELVDPDGATHRRQAKRPVLDRARPAAQGRASGAAEGRQRPRRAPQARRLKPKHRRPPCPARANSYLCSAPGGARRRPCLRRG